MVGVVVVVKVVVVVVVVVVVTVVAVVTVVKVVVILIEAISIMHSFRSPWYNQRRQNRRDSCGPAAPVPRLPRVIKEGNLSAKEFRRIWKDEFLPSIRREMKTKLLELKSSIKALTERCNAIEKSQDFVSKKYDTAIAALQSFKSQSANLDKKYSTITNSLEEKGNNKQDQSLYRVECALHETQQYLRRDCLEIIGVPISSYANPNQLVKQAGSLAGVEIDDRHIAAAHKLPDSKNVKNRLIVKFIQRDKKEELYKNRKNLIGENISHCLRLKMEMERSLLTNP